MQSLIFDGVEIESLRLAFAHQLRCKTHRHSRRLFFSRDAPGLTRTLLLNENAETEERKLGPFQIMNVKAANALHTRWCCLWVYAQLIEN